MMARPTKRSRTLVSRLDIPELERGQAISSFGKGHALVLEKRCCWMRGFTCNASGKATNDWL